jgi:hypothetical protein
VWSGGSNLAPGPLGSVAGDPERHRGWLLCVPPVPAAGSRGLRPRVSLAQRPFPQLQAQDSVMGRWPIVGIAYKHTHKHERNKRRRVGAGCPPSPRELIGPRSYVPLALVLVVVRPVGAAPVRRCVYSRRPALPEAKRRAGYALYFSSTTLWIAARDHGRGLGQGQAADRQCPAPPGQCAS